MQLAASAPLTMVDNLSRMRLIRQRVPPQPDNNKGLTLGRAPASRRHRPSLLDPRPVGPLLNWVLAVLGVLIVIGIWYVLSVTGLILKGRLPSPGLILTSAWALLTSHTGLTDIWVSTRRVIEGLFLGVGVAIPVGFALSVVPKLQAGSQAILNFLRALPAIALIPLVILYLGIGEPARVLVITWSAFFVGVVIMYDGITSTDRIYVRAAAVLGATRWELFARVVLPLALPTIFTALRVGLAVSWGTLVAAELVAAHAGLGYLVSLSAEYFNIADIYAGIIFIGILALAMDRLLAILSRKLLRWQEGVR